MSNFERIIKFTPAYDKRDSNPNKNYGVHGVDMRWYLKGPKGTIQFVVFTNWHLPHVREEIDQRMIASRDRLAKSDLRVHYHPYAADIGYHSYKPLYESHTPVSYSCEWTGGEPCYYDGSSLQAEPILNTLISEGSEAVWSALEDKYNSIFLER